MTFKSLVFFLVGIALYIGFLPALNPADASSSQKSAAVNRTKAIDNAMDCVRRNTVKTFEWSDICSTHDAPSKLPQREDMIDSVLDDYSDAMKQMVHDGHKINQTLKTEEPTDHWLQEGVLDDSTIDKPKEVIPETPQKPTTSKAKVKTLPVAEMIPAAPVEIPSNINMEKSERTTNPPPAQIAALSESGPDLTPEPPKHSQSQSLGHQPHAREDVKNNYARYEANQNYEMAPETSPKFFESTWNLQAGHRTDKLIWNIAGDISGCCPNILSELTWEKLHSYVIKGSGDVVFFDKFVLDGAYAYGDIYEGENQDSDYLGDDRTFEFSRSNNNGGGGDVKDMALGVGYRFYFDGQKLYDNLLVENLSITPLAGYSRHEQNLRISDGFQTIPNSGPFPGVGSSYETEWEGPWLGFQLQGEIKRFTAGLRFEYHWADYDAVGHWNLRSDLAHPRSYEHSADGSGRVFGITGGYKVTDNLSVKLAVDIQDWNASDGVDRVFTSSGSQLETRFNEVEWNSYSVMGGLTYKFGL